MPLSWLAFDRFSDRQLVQWSLRFNVLLDESSKGGVSARLRRGRSFRWVSFAVGINIGMLPMYMNVIDVERAAEYSNQLTAQAPFAIAAVGAVLAELTMVSQPNGVRSADLDGSSVVGLRGTISGSW